MNISNRLPDPRRAGARILDTAEGVLIALRGCTLNQAFVEIVRTAKRHNVARSVWLMRWWPSPKPRRPKTSMTLTRRSSPPAPRGATSSTRPRRAAPWV
jgi:hypothetical protein